MIDTKATDQKTETKAPKPEELKDDDLDQVQGGGEAALLGSAEIGGTGRDSSLVDKSAEKVTTPGHKAL